MLNRLGPLPRLLLGLGLGSALAAVAALWWWWPARPRATLAGHGASCDAIEYADIGTLVVKRGDALVVWDLQSGRTAQCPLRSPYQELLVAPDGQTLAFSERVDPEKEDAVIRLWRPAGPDGPINLPGEQGLTCFTADGRFLVTWAGGRYRYRLWELATGRERRFPVAFAGYDGAYPLPDGRLAVTEYIHEPGWFADQVGIKVWVFDAELRVLGTPLTLPDICGPIHLTPAGDRFAAWKLGYDPSRIKLFDLATGREIAAFPGDFILGAGPVVKFSADGSRLLTGGQTLWDIASTPPRRLGSVRNCPLLSADGEWLAARASSDFDRAGDWEFIEVTGWQKHPWAVERHGDPQFAPRGTLVAARGTRIPSRFAEWLAEWVPGLPAARPSEVLQVRSLPDWSELAVIVNPERYAFFRDGQLLAVGQADGTIEVWDIPPRRTWWIEYGLPAVFALLLLLATRLVWRAARKPREPAPC